jgi:hypothetical protein
MKYYIRNVMKDESKLAINENKYIILITKRIF